jgi:GT2 family glycosyltransferase
MTASPRVRVVVLNHNGGDLTLDGLAHLARTGWPAHALELVLVDNASTDGVAERVERDTPAVRVIRSETNRGFAGGSNLALRELGGIEYVALVNNDATVEPAWLAPLVAALEDDRALGAACPKILFAGRYLEIELRSETHRVGWGDRRRLGVRVDGVEIGGEDRWPRAQTVRGFWGPEPDSDAQWTSGAATLRVPVPDHGPPFPDAVLRLTADRPTRVTLTSGNQDVEHVVAGGGRRCSVPLAGEPFDVVNNVGTVLVDAGYGADRGYLERDNGQYERAEDVFAWCGAAVLLRTSYLRDVGIFDERLFLYCEDLELAWRGRRRGWRYGYVPRSVVRHLHSATSVAGSALADHYKERNHLAVLARHASASLVARAMTRYLLVTASYARRDLVSPLLRGRRPRSRIVVRRLRALAAYLRIAPAMLVARWRRNGGHRHDRRRT